MKQLLDEHFGSLLWDEDFAEWQGSTTIPPHGEVDIGVPPQYIDVEATRQHILATLDTIRREERHFRETATDELYTKGDYSFFVKDALVFNQNEFVNNMHLAVVTFSLDFPEIPITLNYKVGKATQNGIYIVLTWDGDYRFARTY